VTVLVQGPDVAVLNQVAATVQNRANTMPGLTPLQSNGLAASP
jgi:hypothetical protein